MFGLIVVGYLLGGTSPLFAALNNPLNNQNSTYCANTSGECYSSSGTSFFSSLLNALGGYVLNVNNLLAVGILGIVIGLSVLTGQLNLLAIIPLALTFFIVQFAVLPTSFITGSGLPSVVQVLLQAFFYLLTFLTLLSFMRTGN